MTPKEYIISELKTFIKRFPSVRVRYEYDEPAFVHTIEVLPSKVYHFDEDYIAWESEMYDKFIELYYENICFITNDALVGIEHVDFELCGEKFVATSPEFALAEKEVPLIEPSIAAKKRSKSAYQAIMGPIWEDLHNSIAEHAAH
jgi:hypothetical protein